MINSEAVIANVFEKYATGCREKKKAERFVVANETAVAEEKRTALSVSLILSDKKALKLMAAEKETIIVAIIYERITVHRKEMSSFE